MVGTSASTADRPEPNTPGAPVLKLNGLSTLGDRGLEAFSNLSFQVNAGEIIGIAGVAGNGQRELADVIAGLRPSTSGSLLMNDADITDASPQFRFRSGLAYIPEDRLELG